MNREELLARYAAGERNFSGVDLRHPDHVGIDLTKLPIDNVYNKGIDLRKASLEGINLSQAVLYGARFENANLRGANLSRAFARQVDFNNANLVGANLSGIDCQTSAFPSANLSKANLQRADFGGYTCFVGANLSEANLSQANLEGANIDYSDLYQASLVGANLQYACMSNTSLCNCDLSRANLSQAELSYVKFRGSNLNGANLSGAFLNGVDVVGADLTTVNLTGTKRRGSSLILTTCPTNPKDIEIVNQLRAENLLGFTSDGDYEFSFFIWEIPGKNIITIEDILEWGEYETKTAYEVHDLSSYFKDAEITAVYEDNLTDVKLYLVSEGEDSVYYVGDVYVVGKTPTGNFAGCSAQPG